MYIWPHVIDVSLICTFESTFTSVSPGYICVCELKDTFVTNGAPYKRSCNPRFAYVMLKMVTGILCAAISDVLDNTPALLN